MTRIHSFAAVMSLAIGHSATVLAAAPLDYFSSEADVVIRLKAPAATTVKADELADAVQPGAGDMVRQHAARLGKAFFIPGLAGADQSRDWYLILFARGHSMPARFFAIPATDAEQLTNVLPDQMTFKVEEDWVLYTPGKTGVPEMAEPGTGISSVLHGDLAAVFDRGDVSVFINIDHLRSTYRDEIESGHEKVEEMIEQIGAALEQMAEAGTQPSGMNMQPILEMYGTMADGLFQALDDASGCSVGVTVGAEGVGIEEFVTFADESVTSQSFGAQPTSAMESLAQLPSDALAVFGFSGDMQRFMEWSWSMNASMLADNAEQKDDFKKAREAWKSIEFGDMVGSFSLGTAAEGLLRYTAIAHATPIAKVRQNMREMTEILGTIETPGFKQEMTLQPDAETIGTHQIDVMTVNQEFNAELDPTGMQEKMLQTMFGPGGMVSRIAYLDDAYVMAMGGGRDAMETLLKSFDGTPNPDFAQHRNGLIDEPNLLILVDIPSLAVQGLTAATEIPNLPIPIDADALSQLPIEPSYIGFSLAGETDALRVRTFIPVGQFRGIMTLVGFVQQVRQR